MRTLSNEIENRFSQASELLKEIDMEIRTLDSKSKEEKTSQMTSLKKKYSDLQAQYNTVVRDLQRSNLMGGKSEADRKKFCTAQDRYVKR